MLLLTGGADVGRFLEGGDPVLPDAVGDGGEEGDLGTGFIFVRTASVQNGKCSPFLELTPTF